MAGLRVTAIPHEIGKFFDKPFWYVFMLATDPDGTPRTGLAEGNFGVRVHTPGIPGQLETPVKAPPVATLQSVDDVLSTPGSIGY
jgi:hypothetical protein